MRGLRLHVLVLGLASEAELDELDAVDRRAHRPAGKILADLSP